MIEAKRGVLHFGIVTTQCCGQVEQRGKGMQWDLQRHRVYVKTTCHSGLWLWQRAVHSAQRREGIGGRNHGNTSCHSNHSDGEGPLYFKGTGTPPWFDDVCYSLVTRDPLATILFDQCPWQDYRELRGGAKGSLLPWLMHDDCSVHIYQHYVIRKFIPCTLYARNEKWFTTNIGKKWKDQGEH